jgi:hypothetical protein
MSRSFKKPWVKGNSPDLKKVCSRMHRRIARQILKRWRYCWTECWGNGCEDEMVTSRWAPWDDDEYEYGYCGFICNCHQFTAPMEPTFPTRKELVDQYDICDWKFYAPRNRFLKDESSRYCRK